MKKLLLMSIALFVFADPPWTPDVKVSQDPGSGNQNETTMAILNDTLICAGWNDNRMGLYHVGFATSIDGGSTWQETLFIEPTYASDADPMLTVDHMGTIYYFWISYGASSDIFLIKSTDWGQTWSDFICVTPNTPSFQDKPWAAIDSNNVFVTWMEGGGSIRFARSTDYGETWPSSVPVGSGGNGSMPIRGTDSLIYVGWGIQSIKFTKSTDMGATWSSQTTIIPVTWSPGGTPYRLNNIPSFATSRDRSILYVVFACSRLGTNQLDVFFSRSSDEGTTWMTPVKMNDTPAGDTTLQFYPWMSVDPDDNIHVVWHDTREGSRYQIAQYYANSSDTGSTWSVNERVSDTVAYTNTFIGDYTASAADSGYIYALWCDCRNGSGNPDIFFSKRPNDVSVVKEQIVVSHKHFEILASPNPFTDRVMINYQLLKPTSVNLSIYDIQGRLIKTIIDDSEEAGTHSAIWNGQDKKHNPVPSGVYFYKLTTDQATFVKKLIHVK